MAGNQHPSGPIVPIAAWALPTPSCPLGATGILLTALAQSQLFLQVLEARGLTASVQERIKGAMPGMLTVIS